MKDKPSTAIQRFEEAEASLATSPLGKALVDGGLSLIPGLGQAIASALSTRAANVAAKHTAALVTELRAGVQQLGEEKLDAEFLESDEFSSLLVRTLNMNARSARTEKIRLFGKVFLGFLKEPGLTSPFKESFLRIVDELEPEHVQVLRLIHRDSGPLGQPADSRGRARVEQLAKELDLPEGRVLAYGVQMMRFGLVQDDSIGRTGYAPGRWVITSYGREFCEHLGEDHL